jgi:hypothetical protein
MVKLLKVNIHKISINTKSFLFNIILIFRDTCVPLVLPIDHHKNAHFWEAPPYCWVVLFVQIFVNSHPTSYSIVLKGH